MKRHNQHSYIDVIHIVYIYIGLYMYIPDHI